MDMNYEEKWCKIRELIKLSLSDNSKNILIQSGHFSLLFNSQGELIPAVLEEINDEKLRDFVAGSSYMSDFPEKTFCKGVEIAAELKRKSKNVKFSFIVNDWQWINKGPYDFQVNRFEYYRKKSLPKFYNKLLQQYNFNFSDIVKVAYGSEYTIFYSENKLRKQGRKVTSNCSHELCAAEYLPFLKDSLEGFDTLISFIPMLCKKPVLSAASRFIKEQSFNVDLFHIFYSPVSKEFELSLLNKVKIL